MEGIEIKAISKAGEKALKQHLDECKKMKIHIRIQFNAMYEQKVISKEPFILSLKVINKWLKDNIMPEQLIKLIQDAMDKNGAMEKHDYEIKVIE